MAFESIFTRLCRDRSKQRYEILEETVQSMTKRLEELEERKASLQAEVNAFRIQQNFRGNPKRVLLPQIEQVMRPILCSQIEKSPALYIASFISLQKGLYHDACSSKFWSICSLAEKM